MANLPWPVLNSVAGVPVQYGLEAIIYLNAILRALPSFYGSISFTHLEENSSMIKLPYLC